MTISNQKFNDFLKSLPEASFNFTATEVTLPLVNVKVKRLHPDAILPQLVTRGSFKLYAVEDVIIEPYETKKIPLGLEIELPPGYAICLTTPSEMSYKTKLRQSNSVHMIAASKPSEVVITLDNTARYEAGSTPRIRNLTGKTEYYDGSHFPKHTYIVHKGECIAEAVIQPLPSIEISVV